MKLTSVMLFALLILFNACEKKEETEWSKLSAFSKSDNPVITPDSVLIKELYDEFQPEREAIEAQLKSIDPSKHKLMMQELERFDTVTSVAVFNNLKTAFLLDYQAFVQQAWTNLGYDRKIFSARAAGILGNIPFRMGDFGEIVTTYTRSPLTAPDPTSPYDLSDDDIWNDAQNYWPVYYPGASGQILASNRTDFRIGSYLATYWSGDGSAICGIELNKSYKYFRIDVMVDSGLLEANGIGLGIGGSFVKLEASIAPPVGQTGPTLTRHLGSTSFINPFIGIPVGMPRLMAGEKTTFAAKTDDYIKYVRVFVTTNASAGMAGVGSNFAMASVNYRVLITYFN